MSSNISLSTYDRQWSRYKWAERKATMFRGKKRTLDGFSFTFPQNVSQPFDPVILVYPLSHVDPKVNLFTFFLEL